MEMFQNAMQLHEALVLEDATVSRESNGIVGILGNEWKIDFHIDEKKTLKSTRDSIEDCSLIINIDMHWGLMGKTV